MQVGDLVRLAKWCRNGPVLMQVTSKEHSCIKATFLEGPKIGIVVKVSKSNIFILEVYDEAMKKHYERR